MATVQCIGCGAGVESRMIACSACRTPIGVSGGTRVDAGVSALRASRSHSGGAVAKADAFAKCQQGADLLEDGDYEGAIERFTGAIALKPDFVDAHRRRADAYRNLGRQEDAAADMEKVATIARSRQRQDAAPRTYHEEDSAGTGRYVLSFLLAGFVGLGIQYALRNKGWLATWINAVIFVGVVILLVATGE